MYEETVHKMIQDQKINLIQSATHLAEDRLHGLMAQKPIKLHLLPRGDSPHN